MMDWPGVSTYFPRHLPPSFLQLETSTWTCFLGSGVIWSLNRSHLKYQICPAAYCQTESSPVFLCSYITGRTYRMAVVFSFPHTGAPEQEYRQRHKKKDRCRVYSYPTPLYVPVQLYSYPTPLYVSSPLFVQLNSYATLHPSAAVSIYQNWSVFLFLIQPLTSLYKCTMFPLSNKSWFESNRLWPILNCHAISKNTITWYTKRTHLSQKL